MPGRREPLKTLLTLDEVNILFFLRAVLFESLGTRSNTACIWGAEADQVFEKGQFSKPWLRGAPIQVQDRRVSWGKPFWVRLREIICAARGLRLPRRTGKVNP